MTEDLVTFLGWATLVHFGLLAAISIALISLRGWIIGVHQKMFPMSEEALNVAYFQYLAGYKILVTVFFMVPYLVLRMLI